MSWDESAGRVSRAYDEWLLIERDQRAFLKLGLRFSREMYDRLWEEAGNEPGDPDGPDQVDLFDARVEALWPHDYEWMHNAAVLRDAVTNFEVYLEKAREEVLEHHGHPHAVPDFAPKWRDLKRFYRKLGIKIESGHVRDARDLRHFLTHRRGELRTEEQRCKFAAEYEGMPPIAIELPEDGVLAEMDALAVAVRSIDVAVYAHSWGGARIAELVAESLSRPVEN